MSSAKPTRKQADLADVLELILDKGIVINADIAITVGQTELLGIEIRATIASFETAAEYGLAFPSGTDMRRVEQASGREPLDDGEEDGVDLGIDASEKATSDPPSERPDPTIPLSIGDDDSESETADGAETDGDEPESEAEDGEDSETDGDEAEGEQESGNRDSTDDTTKEDEQGNS